jgi:hypothetical protein
VIGVDLSDSMFRAATDCHQVLRLRGSVLLGDAFQLPLCLAGRNAPDLVASVRFIYYFDRLQRIHLLQAMAQASARYVLVQYKTIHTPKGQRNAADAPTKRAAGFVKQFCTDEEIREEIQSAGLECLKIRPIGVYSDRVFVLAAMRPAKAA